MRNDRTVFLVVYGGDLENNGLMIGTETKLRCNKVAQIYQQTKKHNYDTRVIISAGIMSNYPKQKQSMSFLMSQYLVGALRINGEDLLIEHCSRNSGSETITAIKMIHNFCQTRHCPKRYEIIVVSSWYHLFRLCYLWWKYGKNQPRPRFYAAKKKRGLLAILREIPATIAAVSNSRGPLWVKNSSYCPHYKAQLDNR